MTQNPLHAHDDAKKMTMILVTILVVALSAGFIYFFALEENVPVIQEEETEVQEEETVLDLSSQNAENLIKKQSDNAMLALKDKDFATLSNMVHPEKGVRISPYTFVDLENDVVLSSDELGNIMADSKVYLWGSYDGSGEKIEKSFMEYYDEFIYNQAFIDAEQVSYNDPIGTGNLINNNAEVYPDSIIVEYYFSGFDPQYDGMDWESLKLVFEQKADEWYMVGIIHNSWTI